MAAPSTPVRPPPLSAGDACGASTSAASTSSSSGSGSEDASGDKPICRLCWDCADRLPGAGSQLCWCHSQGLPGFLSSLRLPCSLSSTRVPISLLRHCCPSCRRVHRAALPLHNGHPRSMPAALGAQRNVSSGKLEQQCGCQATYLAGWCERPQHAVVLSASHAAGFVVALDSSHLVVVLCRRGRENLQTCELCTGAWQGSISGEAFCRPALLLSLLRYASVQCCGTADLRFVGGSGHSWAFILPPPPPHCSALHPCPSAPLPSFQ